jgi:hypothetical protein
MGQHRVGRWVAAGLLAGGAFMALGAGPVSARTAVAVCDHWTNSSGGSWDTAANWSSGVPSSGSDVCIDASGNYTVVIGNETITVADLAVGVFGSATTLQIGNGGSGSPHINVTRAVQTLAATTTIDYGFGGTFSADTLVNEGTFEVPSTGFGGALSFGAVLNLGTFSVTGGASLNILPGRVFDNFGGTISNASGTLAVATSGSPAGTLQFDANGLVTNTGTIAVADATNITGGTICGNPISVGAGDGSTGGTVSFSGDSTGSACGPLGAPDEVFIYNVSATISGTIPGGYIVTAGDGGSNHFSLALSGNVTNNGTLEAGWGGTITPAAATDLLTNNGNLVVAPSPFTTNINAPIVNQGQMSIYANATVSIPATTSLSNASGATLTIASGKSLAVASSPVQTGTFIQDGVIANSGTLDISDPVQVNGGSICGNALNLGSGDGGSGGSLAFAANPATGPACAPGQKVNQISVLNVTATITTNVPRGFTVAIGDGGSGFAAVSTPGAFTNAGTLEPGWGATLTVGASGALTNLGTIIIPASPYSTTIAAAGLTTGKTFTIDGPLAVDLSGGTFTNSGTLTLASAQTPSISGAFTQTSKGTLAIPIDNKGAELHVSGAATVAGTINMTGKKFTPAYGSVYPVVSEASTTGTFSTVKGPYIAGYTATNVDGVGRPVATVKLTPNSGLPGKVVKVRGVGYASGESVTIYLDSTGGTVLGTTVATSAGTISVNVSIPLGTSTGSHNIVTLGSGSGQTATAVSTVT